MQNKEQFSSPENFQKYLHTINNPVSVNPEPENQVNNEIDLATEETNQEDTNINEQEAVTNEQEVANNEPEEDSHANSHQIPKSRLNKEIEKRKAIESELNSYKEGQSKLQSQIDELNEMLRRQNDTQSQKAIVPDHNEEETVDPLDSETHNFYMKKIKQLQDMITSLSQENHQSVEDLQKYNSLTYQESVFTKLNPDYQDALAHLVDVETRIAEQIVSPQEAKKAAKGKISQIVNYALNNNKNVPEVMYNMAKQYGYKNTEKRPKTSNIDNITKNLDKSANINEINANMPLSNSGVVDITYALNDSKSKRSGINPDKFHEILARIKK